MLFQGKSDSVSQIILIIKYHWKHKRQNRNENTTYRQDVEEFWDFSFGTQLIFEHPESDMTQVVIGGDLTQGGRVYIPVVLCATKIFH